jgi:hypothetical protein
LRCVIVFKDLPQDSIPVICYNGSLGCLLQRDKSSGNYSRHNLFSFPVQESSTKKLLSFAEDLGLIAQYYNGLTGQVLSVPRTDEHRTLSARYAALVGTQQRFITTYEEALSESQSAKLLVLTLDPDDLLIKVPSLRFNFRSFEHKNECFYSFTDSLLPTLPKMNLTSSAALQTRSLLSFFHSECRRARPSKQCVISCILTFVKKLLHSETVKYD